MSTEVPFPEKFCATRFTEKSTPSVRLLWNVSEILKRYRSNRWQIIYKIVVLKNFAKFTGKHLYWSLFFNKVSG